MDKEETQEDENQIIHISVEDFDKTKLSLKPGVETVIIVEESEHNSSN